MSNYWFIPLIVESILLLFLIAYDNGLWATLSIAATMLVIHFTGMTDVVEFVKHNVDNVLIGCVVYAVLGVVWSVVKWTLFVYSKKEIYSQYRNEFFKTNNISGNSIPAEHKDKFQRGLTSYGYSEETCPPMITNHKQDMMRWTFYWPFSMINSVVKDFARKLFNVIFDAMKNALQSISNKAWSEFDKDLKRE